jgi:hypothetical protein
MSQNILFLLEIFDTIILDELVKSRNSIEFVIPAKAGIQLFQDVLDPGACPGPDPGFAGVTLQETFYEIIIFKNIKGMPDEIPYPWLFGIQKPGR